MGRNFRRKVFFAFPHHVLALLFSLTFLLCLPTKLLADPYPTLDEMIGSMIMVGFRGSELTSQSHILQLVASGRIGHVILFERDVTTKGRPNIISQFPTPLRVEAYKKLQV